MWYLELRLFWFCFPPFCMSSNIKTAYALVDENLVAFNLTSCGWGGGWCGECEARGAGSVLKQIWIVQNIHFWMTYRIIHFWMVQILQMWMISSTFSSTEEKTGIYYPVFGVRPYLLDIYQLECKPFSRNSYFNEK